MAEQSSSEIKKVPISGIKIGSRFRQDMGDIPALAKSIQELGLLQPIVVSETFELIAGQRRLEACKILGWSEIPANVINLQDIIRGEFDENAIRKDFTVSEMVEIKRAIEPRERQKAEERQRAGTPAADSDKGRASDRISAAIGVSRDTLSKAEKIVEAAEKDPGKYEPIRAKVDRKEMSVNEGYQRVTGNGKKSRVLKKLKIKSPRFEQAINALREARDAGADELDVWIEGGLVVGVGEELEITT